MSTIAIQNLELNKTLDRRAMAQPSGGYPYTGTTSVSGSWSFVNQWTGNGGLKQVGFVKYKVDKPHSVTSAPNIAPIITSS
jgi:hypothetical protein